MSSLKTICIIGPCLKMGGIERASSSVANGLSRLGYIVIYIAIFRQEKFFKLEDKIVYDEPDPGINEKSLALLPTISRIRKKVNHYQPDAVLVYNKFYAALVAFAIWRTGTHYFLSERSSPFYKWPLKISLLNRIAFFLNPPVGVIAQTKIAAKYQAKYYNRHTRISVIPNSLEVVTEMDLRLENQQILAVGRLSDYLKGFDRLIKAMKFVHPNWILKIVGAENTPTPLYQLISEEGLQERVKLEPKTANLHKHYSDSSIFVIPSRSEGFPNALIEAMAAGLPPVSYDFIGGPDDIIENGKNGLLVKEGDIEGLAHAINRLVDDFQLRKEIGKNASAAKENYSCEMICLRIAQFLNV